MPEFRRQKIRLATDNYRGQRRYFLTLCFYRRRKFGANPSIAKWLISEIRQHATRCEFLVHSYSVMPDHLHIFAEGKSVSSNMLKFVESLKQATAADYAGPLWQHKYYDHILRREDSFDRVAWYIWMNPVRQGLCNSPRDYPFSGAMTPAMEKMFQGSAAVEWQPPWKTEKQSAQRC